MRAEHWIIIATLAVALPAAAHAGGPIALEIGTGPRSADGDEVLRPVFDELRRRGFRVGAALASEVERTASRGAGQLSVSQSLEAERWVRTAYEGLVEGEYLKAANAAEHALAMYAIAPGQLAREPAMRDQQYRALIIAARAYEVLGRAEDSFRHMSDAIRRFPDRHVSVAEFDPRVNALFRRVKAELTKQGTGTLAIEVDDPAAVIFLAGRFVGTGTAEVGALYPGDFEVFVAKAASAGRVHTARINPGEKTTLSISWAFDAALRTSAGQVVLEVPPGTTPKQELALATRLGRELGAKTVVVLALRELDERRAVVGYAIETASMTKTFAALQVEPIEPPPATLARLSALLAGDKSVGTAGIVTSEAAFESVLRGRPTEEPWYTDRWGLGLGGAGVLLTGVAVGLLWSADGLRDEANQTLYEAARDDLRDRAGTRTLTGSLVGAVGVGLVAAGAIKLFWPSSSSTPESNRTASARLRMGAGWVFIDGRF